jgi:glucose-6-phosphate dehydrogenase assembly protein OpcA
MRHSFEQITILATGDAVRAAASIAQPLFKPDLPVYVWWLNDPPEDMKLFMNFVDISNRVIVDSSNFLTPEDSLSTLSSLMQEAPQSSLSDLNWGRITPWRQLVAQFFDSTEYRPYLAGVKHIEIEHATTPPEKPVREEQGSVSPNSTCALMLAGWLKNSLGWRMPNDNKHAHHDSRTGKHSWRMERLSRSTGPLGNRTGKGGSLARGLMEVRPLERANMRPGSLCTVRLVSSLENRQATFTISHEDDPDHVVTSVELSQGTRPDRTVNLAATRNVSELLHEELEIVGRDHLYDQTLKEVSALLA